MQKYQGVPIQGEWITWRKKRIVEKNPTEWEFILESCGKSRGFHAGSWRKGCAANPIYHESKAGRGRQRSFYIDALLERLGRASGMFERILDQEEEESYRLRLQIIRQIRERKLVSARKGIEEYQHYITHQSKKRRLLRGSTLEKQFIKIMEIRRNCLEICGVKLEL